MKIHKTSICKRVNLWDDRRSVVEKIRNDELGLSIYKGSTLKYILIDQWTMDLKDSY